MLIRFLNVNIILLMFKLIFVPALNFEENTYLHTVWPLIVPEAILDFWFENFGITNNEYMKCLNRH